MRGSRIRSGVVWTVAFALVAVVHLGHAVMMPGRHRVWHAGHIVMAAGMVVMFWPGQPMSGFLAAAGVWVYASAAGLAALGWGIARWRRIRPGWLWLAGVADFAAMAYMFAMMSAQLAWLSVAAAVWFAAQTVGWASGWWPRVLEHGGLGEPAPATRAVSGIAPPNGVAVSAERVETRPDAMAPAAGVAGSGPAGGIRLSARAVTAVRRRVIDGGIRDWSVRITLAVMAAGMGYMIVAMQFGMPTVNTTAGM